MPISAPSDLANLTAWLEGDSVTGVPSGDTFTVWPESGPVSGNEDLSNDSFVSSRPKWMDNVLNGRAVVDFFVDSDGGGGANLNFFNPSDNTFRTWYPTTASLLASPLFSLTGGTALIIMRASGIHADDLDSMFWGLFWDRNGASAATNRNGIGIRRTAGGYEAVVSVVDGATAGDVKELSWSIDEGGWVMIEMTHDGVTLSGRVNGCTPQSIACGEAYSSSELNIAQGERMIWAGEIARTDPVLQVAALTCYDRVLTDQELCDLRDYFADAAQYDLTICHPCAVYVPTFAAVWG